MGAGGQAGTPLLAAQWTPPALPSLPSHREGGGQCQSRLACRAQVEDSVPVRPPSWMVAASAAGYQLSSCLIVPWLLNSCLAAPLADLA